MKVVLVATILYHVSAYLPSRMQSKPFRRYVSTDNIISTSGDIKAEGTMMSSPAFKIIDFIMSIPIVHGLCFLT